MSIKGPLAIALALLLGFIGQSLFLGQGPAVDGIILFALAALCLLVIPPRHSDRTSDITQEPGLRRPRLLLIGLGVFLVLLCLADLYVLEASNRALVLWSLGTALFVAGFWIRSPRPIWGMRRREVLLLAVILAVALFMRVYRLNEMPPGVYLDEADNGVWGLRFLQDEYSPFTEHRDGNATLPFQLLGVALRFFGVKTSVLRGFDVAIGLLTVVAFYFLAREMFGAVPALIGTAFLSFARWHVHFSRVGFVDNLQVPLFETVAVLFLWRGLRSGRRLDYVFAGLSFGLGFHTYIGYRIFPMVIGAYLLHLALFRRGWLRSQLRGLLVFGVSTFIALSPLALYAVERPQLFVRRAEAASVLQDIERESSYRPLLENAGKSLLMYNRQGDPRPRHNLPDEPMLDGLSAVFLGLGLGYSVLRWRHDRYFLLVAWLLLGLLPGILSLADSNPHSLRTLGNVPAVFLLITAFWDRAWKTYDSFFPGKSRRYLFAAVAVVLLLSLGANFWIYFDRQASNESVYYDFDPAQTEAGNYVKGRGDEMLVLVSHALTNHSDLKFIPYGVPFTVLDLNAHLPLRGQVDRDTVYVLEWAHGPLIPRLEALYPQGEYMEHLDRYGRTMFYTYIVSREEVAGAQGLLARYYEGSGFREPAALERIDKQIALSGNDLPLPPPFSARWAGSLYVPQYGSYTFILESSGWSSLQVGSDLEMEVESGRAQRDVQLAAGFHSIEVKASQDEAGDLGLRWVRPDHVEEMIPGDALYVADLYSHGLLGLYRRGTGWDGEAEVAQLDGFIAPNDVLPSPFSIEWSGQIYAPVSGIYAFGTTSDDGSYLFLDDQLVVDNGGHHGDVYREGQLQLEAGVHDIRLRYFQDGGGRKIELYWAPPGEAREQVPQEQLFPPGARVTTPSPRPPVAVPTPPPATRTLGEVGYSTSWGGPGEGPGQFNEPRGVAVSLEGMVYVADTGNGRVQAFDGEGRFLGAWGGDVLGEPCDLAVGVDGRVYVVDVESDSIIVFSSDGELEERWGDQWGLFDPRGIGVDEAGNLYVANTGGSRVIKISPHGDVLETYGGGELGGKLLSQPTDVALDNDGNIYVVDTENSRLVVLDKGGQYLREWPISPANTADGPHVVAGMDDLLYLTDPEMARVLVYDPYGRLVGSWGEKGFLEGQFSKPIGVGFDQRNSLYVADTYNHRIEKFGLQR